MALSEAFEPSVVRAVASADTSALDDFADASGCEPIASHFRRLQWEAIGASTSPERFEEVKALVLPHMERVAAFTSRRYGCACLTGELARFRHWSHDNVQSWYKLHGEFERVVSEDSIPAQERIAWAVSKLPALDSALPGYGGLRVRDRIAQLYGTAGWREKELEAYRDILRRAVADDIHTAVCNYAGFVGAVHPDADSSFHYFRLGLETAREHEFVSQQARLLSFIANNHHTRGRFSLAESYFSEAMSLYDRYPRAPAGDRFLREAADRYRRLGWYDEAERALDRAELALERSELHRPQLERSRAAVLGSSTLLTLARGEKRKAESLRGQALPLLMPLQVEFATGLMMDYATEQLRQLDLEGCLETIRQALALWPDDERLDTYRRGLYARQAYVYTMLGREQGARDALARYETAADSIRARSRFDYGPDQRTLVLVSRAQLGLREAGADSAGVIGAVDRELRSILAHAERGAHRYLWLDQNAVLRDLYEDVAAGDTRLQLGVDLYWRSLHTASPRRADSNESLRDTWRAYAQAVVRLAAAEDAEILVYSIRKDGVHRYRVRASGVDASNVTMPVAELRALVNRAWHGLATEPRKPDASIDAALAGTLNRLARALLPADLRAGDVLVAADGFLSRLPFEALNLSREGYQPLLAHSDVVYLHGIDFDRARVPGDHSVVLADPDVPREVQRRVDGYARLPGARAEANHAAEHLPGARIATDDRATVQWLRRHWEGARYIHIATHAVDDPNVPYHSLLALAGGNGSGAVADVFLDPGDVLDADLSACEVAILSGCATGAPRAGGGSVTPSFGDAFIDAGAQAVVQTFWNVRDDIAAETMRNFVRHWREEGLRPSTALQRTRRDVALARPHPHYWAAYSVEVAGDARR